MGLLRDLTATTPSGSAADAAAIRDLLSAAVVADGTVDHAEHITVEALYETVPQLQNATLDGRPPLTNRKALLATLATLEDTRLRKQLFVLAIDLVLASEGATDREDVFVEELRGALRLDEAFARQAITVLAYKYARAR